MEITRCNFPELFPSVKDAIDECDFLAVDTELTGLSTHVTEHAFDTVAERYSKLRENCMPFLVIQYGLSTYKYHPQQNKYTHKDFNFYVFPRQHMRRSPDPKFMCQTSSLHFLATNGFDFNKVISDGLPYLSPASEDKIKDFLESKHKNEQNALKGSNSSSATNGQKVVDIPPEQRQFIAEVHERVETFIANEDESVIHLDPCSGFQRKLIYDSVQQKHQSGIEMSTILNEENKRLIAIVKTTDEEKYERLQTKQINDLADLDSAVGFRKVLDYMLNTRKLIVGHNMLLDMMHTIDKFFFPIPENVDEFKSILHATFPQIMDTKVLASSEKLRQFFDSTSLGEVLKQLQGKAFQLPVIEPADGFKGYTLQSDKAHEAGYDAFMSGYCYIGMMHKLAAIEKQPLRYYDPASKILNPYFNRIFIMRHYDIHTLNVSAPDPEPDRDNVFYVSFPQEWKTFDLVELFLPYGTIYVNWLDDVSALVALKSKDNVINAKTNLLNKPSRVYTVRSYSEYQKATTKPALPPPPKRKTEAKRAQASSNNEPSTNKRRASGSAEIMEFIPEADESEAEKADSSVSTSHGVKISSVKSKASSSQGPPSKKQKRCHDENEAEVSSTEKVFEEDNAW